MAIGKIAEMQKTEAVVRRVHVDDVEAEIARYHAAKEQAQAEILELRDKAEKEVGEAQAEIFEDFQSYLATLNRFHQT